MVTFVDHPDHFKREQFFWMKVFISSYLNIGFFDLCSFACLLQLFSATLHSVHQNPLLCLLKFMKLFIQLLFSRLVRNALDLLQIGQVGLSHPSPPLFFAKLTIEHIASQRVQSPPLPTCSRSKHNCSSIYLKKNEIIIVI